MRPSASMSAHAATRTSFTIPAPSRRELGPGSLTRQNRIQSNFYEIAPDRRGG
jgi:hypothetical protein